MPERFPGTRMDDLRVNDYFEGKGGVVWKVTHEVDRDDGHWIGAQNAAGERAKVRTAGLSVTVLVYEPVGQQVVAEALGGKVLAEQVEHKWFHPAHSVLEDDEGLLRAHLVRFHETALTDDMRLGDFIVLHRGIHTHDTVNHEHNEEHRS